jgi:hypothetical protein
MQKSNMNATNKKNIKNIKTTIKINGQVMFANPNYSKFCVHFDTRTKSLRMYAVS